jgi:hypothetical protein
MLYGRIEMIKRHARRKDGYITTWRCRSSHTRALKEQALSLYKMWICINIDSHGTKLVGRGFTNALQNANSRNPQWYTGPCLLQKFTREKCIGRTKQADRLRISQFCTPATSHDEVATVESTPKLYLHRQDRYNATAMQQLATIINRKNRCKLTTQRGETLKTTSRQW